jgi:hypothetical protein
MIRYLAAAAVLTAGPAVAQATHAHDHSMHADHADHSAHGAVPAKLTIDSPIEALMADPKAKAAVEASMPGVDAHPAYGQFKAMSLKQVQPFSNGAITEDMLAKIEAALSAIEG